MSSPVFADVLSERERQRLAERVAATGVESEEITVRAPFTDEVLGSVPACDGAAVEAAVERARDAQTAWAERPVAERAAIVNDAGAAILAERDSLLDVIQAESGKARLDALEEVVDVSTTASYYARTAPAVMASESRRGAIPGLTSTTEHRRPVGVVGLVSPWNYPLTLTVADALPALAAGNAVVLKPANETPFTALAAAEIIADAGVPRDLFQVVTGHGAAVGEPLVANVDFVGFTGSTETGREVAALAGEHLVDCSLELGGKNPAVVCADAPMEKTVTGLVRGCFANAGQLCISIERIYVEEPAFEGFRSRFVDHVGDLELGRGLAFDADVGSLISDDQLARVEGHVQSAVDDGATVETGGVHRPDVGPLFYAPTVLTDVDAASAVACEETFGPVVRVESVPDVDAAVERANDSDYGLHANVWTADARRGREIASRIDCGTVAVNDAYGATWASVDAPMGGTKDSGIGRRHGREGIEKYTETRTVALQRGHPIARPAWLPRSVAARGFTAMARVRRWLDRHTP